MPKKYSSTTHELITYLIIAINTVRYEGKWLIFNFFHTHSLPRVRLLVSTVGDGGETEVRGERRLTWCGLRPSRTFEHAFECSFGVYFYS